MSAPKPPKDAKAERLAQALRANLRRRKTAAQGAGRITGRPADEKPSPDEAAPFRDKAEPR